MRKIIIFVPLKFFYSSADLEILFSTVVVVNFSIILLKRKD